MPIVEDKEASRYTDNGSAVEHCSICDHWRARDVEMEGNCQIVSGTVLQGGWCRHFRYGEEARG